MAPTKNNMAANDSAVFSQRVGDAAKMLDVPVGRCTDLAYVGSGSMAAVLGSKKIVSLILESGLPATSNH